MTMITQAPTIRVEATVKSQGANQLKETSQPCLFSHFGVLSVVQNVTPLPAYPIICLSMYHDRMKLQYNFREEMK